MSDNYNLVPVAVDALREGIQISDSLFYQNGVSLVLFGRNIVFTEELISKLKERIVSKNVYVSENDRDMLLSGNDYFRIKQKALEDSVGYTRVKMQTRQMINDIGNSETVSVDVAEEISHSIKRRFDEFEAGVIIQCLNGVREADEYLYTHSANVAILNTLIGKWLRLCENDVSVLTLIGLLHDIGKLKVPPHILNKPGRLTAQEFEEMKNHPRYSYETLLKSGMAKEQLLQGVLQHHEKLNGSGYPGGLKLDEISFLARVTAISDVYDAMVAKRVYKDPHSPFEILHQFSVGRFSDLDMNLVNTFLMYMPTELIGKRILMSNGAVAVVRYVNSVDFLHPIVELDGVVTMTDKKLYCVSMYYE